MSTHNELFFMIGALRVECDWSSILPGAYQERLSMRPPGGRMLSREETLSGLEAEILRLRRYAELTISLCEWGPSADFEGDEGDLWAYAMEAQILRVVPHAQPCAIEDCGCAGADELCDFAWRADA